MFTSFAMERWQSLHENRVDFNLSESGVHPLTLRELETLSQTSFAETLLGYGQSNGSELLRGQIAALYHDCPIDSVVVTNGSAEANFIALWVLAHPGDEIVIVMPTYMQVHGLARNYGLQVREVWLHEEHGWQLEEAELDAAVSDRTKVILVTNPGNPTGSIMHAELRAAVVRAAQRVGCWILADEVYSGAELHGAATPSFFGSYERVVATGSLSKAYGLPGIRIGWAVAPQQVAEQLWARKDYLTISPGELTDRMAAIALSPAARPQILLRTRRLLQENWEITRSWLEAQGVFAYHAPAAGAIVYARYHLPVESAALAELLRAQFSLLAVPGSHFQMGRFLRLGYGPPAPYLQAALARLATAISRFR
jgi:aspartate/methionine/tyrosine aminotransferase